MPAASPQTSGSAVVEPDTGASTPSRDDDDELVVGADGLAAAGRDGPGHHELQLAGEGEGLEPGVPVDDPDGEGVRPVLGVALLVDACPTRVTTTTSPSRSRPAR